MRPVTRGTVTSVREARPTTSGCTRTSTSASCAGAFGRLASRVRHLPVAGTPPGEAVEAARRSSEPVPGTILLGGRVFGAEVLNNRHYHLVLVSGRVDSHAAAA